MNQKRKMKIDIDKVITFEKSALKDICKILDVPYDKNIIGFTKEGVIKNIFDLIQEEKSILK